MPLVPYKTKESIVLNNRNIQQIPQRINKPYTNANIQSATTIQQAVQVPLEQQQRAVKKQRQFGNGQLTQKGQKIPIQGNRIQIRAGWDIKNPVCDVDISAFMVDNSRKVLSENGFIFYGNPVSSDTSLCLNKENTGSDDAVINIDLTKIDTKINRIVFVLTIDEAKSQRLNFSMIDNAYIRLTDDNCNEQVRFMLSDYYDTVTSMMLGEIYLYNGMWKFAPIGDGVNKDLAELCAMYGIETI